MPNLKTKSTSLLNSNNDREHYHPVSIEFTEDMHGFFAIKEDGLSSFGKEDPKAYQQAETLGEKANNVLTFRLTIKVEDIDQFLNDPQLTADATGSIYCPALGGTLAVIKGIFNLFVNPSKSDNLLAAKEMHYSLLFNDSSGKPWTFTGYKVVTRESAEELWAQTTTLYTTLWQGNCLNQKAKGIPWAQGILTLNAADFAKQMSTLKSNGHDLTSRLQATARFMEIFAKNIWEAYAPAIFDTETSRWNEHIYPINTTEGVKDAAISMINFNTDDGLSLTLSRFQRKKCKDVVLLLHGLTTSTDMFIMPEHYNLTQYLLDNDFTDVFSLDWRGSNRFPYNLKVHRYSIDDIAMYDVPKAIEAMKAVLEPDTKIHVIAHCVGSIGFMTSMAAGLVKGVSSVISNSVSLTPQIRWQSKIKLKFAPWIVDNVFRSPYISPEISYLPGWRPVKLLPLMERLIRHECKEPACHMISFMWGWGFPAAYEHQNLHPFTHRRLKDLFGGTSMNYFRHMNMMVQNHEAVPYTREGVYHQLPESYLQNITNVDLPSTLFISGDNNHIFPGSNQRTFEQVRKLDKQLPVEFKSFPGYGHQDIFMGKNCHLDVFPTLLAFLRKNVGGAI